MRIVRIEKAWLGYTWVDIHGYRVVDIYLLGFDGAGPQWMVPFFLLWSVHRIVVAGSTRLVAID